MCYIRRFSGDHDGRELADALESVAQYGVLMLYPAMSVKGPHTDSEYNLRIQTVKREVVE
jgi:hypothetical protein